MYSGQMPQVERTTNTLGRWYHLILHTLLHNICTFFLSRESVYDIQGNLLEENPTNCLDAPARKKISAVRNKLEDLIQTAKQSDEGMDFFIIKRVEH